MPSINNKQDRFQMNIRTNEFSQSRATKSWRKKKKRVMWKIKNKYLITEKCASVSGRGNGKEGQNVRGKSMRGWRVDDAEMRAVREE